MKVSNYVSSVLFPSFKSGNSGVAQGGALAAKQAQSAAGDTVQISAAAQNKINQQGSAIPTRDEYVSGWMKVFRAIDSGSGQGFDASSKGVITVDEMIARIEKIQGKGGKNADQMIAVISQGFMDAQGGDMNLTVKEARNYLDHCYDEIYGGPTGTQQSSGSGSSVEEYKEEWANVFRAIDVNSDNEITDKEMVAYINQSIAGLSTDEANQIAAGLTNGFMAAQGGDMKVTKEEAKAFLVQNYKDLYGPDRGGGQAVVASNNAAAAGPVSKDPLFAALNKNHDDYITLDEVNAWIKNIVLARADSAEEAKQLKQKALDTFREAVASARGNGLLDPNQPSNSINYQQYQFYLSSKLFSGGNNVA